MNSKVDKLIENLSPAIEEKCEELKKRRKEKAENILFAVLCAAVVLVPALLVFLGVSITLLIVIPAFMSVSVILLLPVLLSEQNKTKGGKIYE